MSKLRAGIVGCGGRGHAHAKGYAASDDVEIVACADPVGEARWKFQEAFGCERTYKDFRDMLEGEMLDLVSICTWPEYHPEMVITAAGRGAKAIHCEKPMAPNWGGSKALVQTCNDHGVMIQFCHQRRFAPPFMTARKLLKDGVIGKLVRMEGACSNLYDWGTHWFDMFFYYNDDTPAEWVMGQLDAVRENSAFGVQLETSGLSWIRWNNGVEGLLATGEAALQGAANRLIGTEGIIEVGAPDSGPVRFMGHTTQGWETPELVEVSPGQDDTIRATLDLIDAVQSGREPELSGRKALQATELIFASYESSRRRARIALPLSVDDSALLAMLEAGEIGYTKRETQGDSEVDSFFTP
jgi:UDP-N-acetylglucosamine 3-dehydrogenase